MCHLFIMLHLMVELKYLARLNMYLRSHVWLVRMLVVPHPRKGRANQVQLPINLDTETKAGMWVPTTYY